MTIAQVGYGAGDRDDPVTPNVLRVLIGQETAGLKPRATPGLSATTAGLNVAQGFSPAGDRVTVIECEIDDMNPQIFGVVMDRLYAAGALEVFYVSVQMKKNRPGTLLTVVSAPDVRGAMTDIIFHETTTIGLRYYDVDRECLEREVIRVETPLGAVRVKVSRRNGRVMTATPEFDDCATLAAENGLPVKDVQAMAAKAYGARTE